MFKIFNKYTVLFALAASAIGTTSQAAAVRIDCPLTQARTEITSPLPSGWWQTPQQGNLQETKVGNIGGDPTLMCGYWAYGSTVYVMSKAPAGANCSSDASGFTCTTPGVVAAPRTHKSSLLTLNQTWMMDLDNGTTGGRDGADVWFAAATATQRSLEPVNGALIAIVGNQSVGLDGCRSAAGYTGQAIDLSHFRAGTYVCVRTNEGRFSQFRVNTAPGPSPGVMEIGFTTWAN